MSSHRSRIARSCVALWALLVAMAIGPAPAVADHRVSSAPHGASHERVVRHWGYYPRYHHVYHTNNATDPYAYRYVPNGYYPYYNSGYWRSRHLVGSNRAHFKHPVYYKAWGATPKRYKHYRWHEKHHGRHDHAHW
ncbi:MAG: hypothetical protein SH859_16905 [Hyphomicrobium aestuarii]|nr:hypothetical protein [Hyphomicrobium aestuarii]